MPYAPIADLDLSVLLVIDMQRRLMPHIAGCEGVAAAAIKSIRAAHVLSLPVLVTEQNPSGLGQTVESLRDVLPDGAEPIVKEAFSCWGEAAFREALQATQREHVVIVGIETHVCVQQTVLDLLRVDYVPFVLADGVGSRRTADRDVALDRMRQAGAVVTTAEAVILELVQRHTAPTFKAILDIIK